MGALALALVAPIGSAQTAVAKDKPLGRLETPEQRVSKVKAVSGLGAKAAREQVAKDKAANAEHAKRAKNEQKVTWPSAGAATVTLTSKGHVKTSPADIPITLTPRSKARNAAATDAKITVLGQDTAEKAGVTGVLLTAEAGTEARAEISLDYSGFAGAVGGGWSQCVVAKGAPVR